jgi:hypothetical protein
MRECAAKRLSEVSRFSFLPTMSFNRFQMGISLCV